MGIIGTEADFRRSGIDEKYIFPAKEKELKLHKSGINFCHDRDVRNITKWRYNEYEKTKREDPGRVRKGG